jgi:uncharacterized protein (TIGR03083 family)
VNNLRGDQSAREAESWARFETALGLVSRERWAEAGVLPGWSVKELLHHMAGWLDKCARNLGRLGRGEGEEPGYDDIDEVNARLAAEADAMTPEAVLAGLLEARERVLRAWASLPVVDAGAVEELAGETYEHYDEHALDLARFAQ